MVYAAEAVYKGYNSEVDEEVAVLATFYSATREGALARAQDALRREFRGTNYYIARRFALRPHIGDSSYLLIEELGVTEPPSRVMGHVHVWQEYPGHLCDYLDEAVDCLQDYDIDPELRARMTQVAEDIRTGRLPFTPATNNDDQPKAVKGGEFVGLEGL